ncbi:MAG TPA: hemolysin family protein [Sumerlaeia bacterium]|nr:hemolysin family protein [Sumerlaeia bacterium]
MSASEMTAAGVGVALCLLFGMAFSLMETTLLMLNRLRLLQLFGEEQPQPTSEQDVFRDTKDVYFISRLGLCATLVTAGFLLTAAGAELLRERLPADAASSQRPYLLAVMLTLALLTPTYLFCTFGLPRLIVRPISAASETELPAWMRVFIRVVHPLARLSRIFALLPLSRVLPHHHLTKNDLVALVTHLDVDEGEDQEEERSGEDDNEEEMDEQEMVYNILDLEETLVREVMEPINSVVAIRLGDGMTVEGVRELSRRTGHSRFPVYRDRIVDLFGYVSVYDILYSDDPDRPLEFYVTPAYFVPEYMRVSALLQEFLKRGVHVAIVVDEYGGTSGWVTREDVLEEIVGEIEDEFDARGRQLRRCDDGSYLADGATDIDDLSEELPVAFDDPQYDTLAGFILMTLGAIPQVGHVVETDDAAFRVERMDGNRIAQVRIELKGDEGGESGVALPPPGFRT